MYYSQFDSYLLPITCIHLTLHVLLIVIWLIFTTHYLYTRVTHVLLSIWLICTTHYLYTRFTCIVLNLTHIYYSLPVYTCYMYCYSSIWLICTTHSLYTRVTLIVLNLTHIYYPTHSYMYCSQFDSYVLPMPVYTCYILF